MAWTLDMGVCAVSHWIMRYNPLGLYLQEFFLQLLDLQVLLFDLGSNQLLTTELLVVGQLGNCSNPFTGIKVLALDRQLVDDCFQWFGDFDCPSWTHFTLRLLLRSVSWVSRWLRRLTRIQHNLKWWCPTSDGKASNNGTVRTASTDWASMAYWHRSSAEARLHVIQSNWTNVLIVPWIRRNSASRAVNMTTDTLNRVFEDILADETKQLLTRRSLETIFLVPHGFLDTFNCS